MIEKIVMMLLLSYPALTWAQDTNGQKQWNEGYKQWNEGVYKELPFSFPKTLTNTEIESILLSIQSLSVHEVLTIRLQSKDKVIVKTCSHGTRKLLMCDGGEIFVYKKNKKSWDEMPEQRGDWVQ